MLGLTGRDAIREHVRMRDKYTCQKCKEVWVVGTRRFDVHHLLDEDGSMSHGTDRKEEILKPGVAITVCHKCHLNLPTEKAKMVKASQKRKEKKEKRQMAYFRARQAKLQGVDN